MTDDEYIKGWQAALSSVYASLVDYPHGGGDIEIMGAIDKIVSNQKEENERLKMELLAEKAAHRSAWGLYELEKSARGAAERERDKLSKAIQVLVKALTSIASGRMLEDPRDGSGYMQMAANAALNHPSVKEALKNERTENSNETTL